MKTDTYPIIIIRPVDAAMGIYRVGFYDETPDGVRTWHRYRGTLAGARAFCEKHGRTYYDEATN